MSWSADQDLLRPMARSPILAVSTLTAGLLCAHSARAFEDAGCSRIVPTTQTTTVGLRVNETIESARARALDIVSKSAVFEVSGKMLEASRASEQRDDNGQISDRFQDVSKQSYQGLVRVKQTGEALTGFDEHRQLDISAEVSVCVPKTGAELAADREKADASLMASREQAARDRMPPRAVDPETVGWFDPTSGESRVWYWSGPNGEYKFFDKGGYDPVTGDPLKQADRQFVKDWRAASARKRKEFQDAALAQQQAAARREAAEVAARQLAEARAVDAARASQSCDAEAANPNDPRRPPSVAGVQWDDLKINADAAIRDCEAAVRQQPAEPRYRYQLARAYSTSDPKRSMPMFKRLCDEHYPAAYDNYGWALLDRRVGLDDLAGAVRAFDQGIAAGDSDAMTSMASLMIRDRVNLNFPDEPLQLYRRAAQKGNQDAARAVAKLEAERASQDAARIQQEERSRQETAQQEQAARMFMGIVGGALANAGRR